MSDKAPDDETPREQLLDVSMFSRAADLLPGYRVDLEGDRVAKIGADETLLISYECELGIVDEVEIDVFADGEIETVIVTFDNMPAIVFPADHILKLDGKVT